MLTHFTAGPLEHCHSFSRQSRVIFSSLFCRCRLHKINTRSPIHTQPSNYYNVCLLMYVCEHEYQAERPCVFGWVWVGRRRKRGGRLLSDSVVKMFSWRCCQLRVRQPGNRLRRRAFWELGRFSSIQWVGPTAYPYTLRLKVLIFQQKE